MISSIPPPSSSRTRFEDKDDDDDCYTFTQPPALRLLFWNDCIRRKEKKQEQQQIKAVFLSHKHLAFVLSAHSFGEGSETEEKDLSGVNSITLFPHSWTSFFIYLLILNVKRCKCICLAPASAGVLKWWFMAVKGQWWGCSWICAIFGTYSCPLPAPHAPPSDKLGTHKRYNWFLCCHAMMQRVHLFSPLSMSKALPLSVFCALWRTSLKFPPQNAKDLYVRCGFVKPQGFIRLG